MVYEPTVRRSARAARGATTSYAAPSRRARRAAAQSLSPVPGRRGVGARPKAGSKASAAGALPSDGKTRKFARVLRHPGGDATVGFLLPKWVPVSDLTAEERAAFEAERGAKLTDDDIDRARSARVAPPPAAPEPVPEPAVHHHHHHRDHNARYDPSIYDAPSRPAKRSRPYYKDKRYTGLSSDVRCRAHTTRGKPCGNCRVGAPEKTGHNFCNMHANDPRWGAGAFKTDASAVSSPATAAPPPESEQDPEPMPKFEPWVSSLPPEEPQPTSASTPGTDATASSSNPDTAAVGTVETAVPVAGEEGIEEEPDAPLAESADKMETDGVLAAESESPVATPI